MSKVWVHASFYKFVRIADVPSVVAQLKTWAGQALGTIWVAPEGINAAIAASGEELDALQAQSASVANGLLSGVHFKRSACQTQPFKRLKVLAKPELVPLDIPAADFTAPAGQKLSPAQWREHITRPDVVVLDNRNSFEHRLGHFAGALDPQVAHFRDFKRFVERHAEEWKRTGKTVAMYCTGGIRCEKTAPWMTSLGLQVAQLEGGILNYFEAMPDASADWQGECFVFDNRIAIDTRLQETATTVEQVYEAEPDGAWRIARAKRLMNDD
jgi:UPF0176 protein